MDTIRAGIRSYHRPSRRELATILAALRYWQRCGEFAGPDILAIADDVPAGEEALLDREIDALCDALNTD